jgi:hypothetical protein
MRPLWKPSRNLTETSHEYQIRQGRREGNAIPGRTAFRTGTIFQGGRSILCPEHDQARQSGIRRDADRRRSKMSTTCPLRIHLHLMGKCRVTPCLWLHEAPSSTETAGTVLDNYSHSKRTGGRWIPSSWSSPFSLVRSNWHG